MTTEGVKIKYGDVAPEAKESFSTSVSEKADFVNLSQLQQYNLRVPNYANPCEYFMVPLDGTTTVMPAEPENEIMGYVSENISNANGVFETPIVFTMTAESKFTSKGLTFTFDTYNNIFPDSINIKWYDDDTLLSDKDFTPNTAFYFCSNEVEHYNKLVIQFNSMVLSYSRLRVQSIDFGYGTFFFGNELRAVTVSQQTNPLSLELPINTVSFTLESKNDIEYSFQTKQPLETYFGGELRQSTFVTTSTRTAKRQWRVESEDYIGQMENITFYGDVYTSKNVKELLTSTFSEARIPLHISSDLDTATITGYIAPTTLRDAVQQICFVINAVATTSAVDGVKISKLNDTIVEHLPLSRIRQGQSFKSSERVSQVSLEYYTYYAPDTTSEEAEWENLYKASESGTGENIVVTFSEPHYHFLISNGEILHNTANYAIINAQENCRLRAYKYKSMSQKLIAINDDISKSEHPVEKAVSGVTLVNESNAQGILDKLYDYFLRVTTTKMKFNEGYHKDNSHKYGAFKYGTEKYKKSTKSDVYVFDTIINVGDLITADTEYLGVVTGRILSEKYNCNGSILVKECEVM